MAVMQLSSQWQGASYGPGKTGVIGNLENEMLLAFLEAQLVPMVLHLDENHCFFWLFSRSKIMFD